MVNHPAQVLLGGGVVVPVEGVVNLVVKGDDGVRLQFERPIECPLCVFEASLHLVVVGNVGQVVGIHQYRQPCPHSLLILLQNLQELFVVIILVVVHS